jgi:KDO2-lipid IV(A) lauroyltransferase
MGILRDLLLWLYWYPFRLFIRLIPVNCSYTIARMLSVVYFFLSRRKRRQLEKEYREVFGEIIFDRGAKAVVQKAFSIWLQNELEVLLFSTMNRDNIGSFVRYQGMEHLDNALSSGKGAMLLFAHFGANQMIMPAVGYKGYRMSQLSAPPTVWVEKLPNRKFSPMGKKALELRWEQELSLPVKHINIFGSLKSAFVALKKNEVLGIAVDGGGGKNRIEVDFLGKKALFPTGAIELAMRTECSVLPVFMIRNDEGVHTLIIDPPLKLIRGHDAKYIRKNVELFISRFEPYVVKYPCHYLTFLALRRFMAEQGDTPFLMTGGRMI